MNGLSLLVALATVGVDVGWESTSSGKLTYTIRIESVLVDKLGEGSAIESLIDRSDRGLRKFRVAVGPKNLQTERVAAATANELDYGWRPNESGAIDYYVQISRERLETLARGIPLECEVHPDVPEIEKIYVFVGDTKLPRELPQGVRSSTSQPRDLASYGNPRGGGVAPVSGTETNSTTPRYGSTGYGPQGDIAVNTSDPNRYNKQSPQGNLNGNQTYAPPKYGPEPSSGYRDPGSSAADRYGRYDNTLPVPPPGNNRPTEYNYNQTARNQYAPQQNYSPPLTQTAALPSQTQYNPQPGPTQPIGGPQPTYPTGTAANPAADALAATLAFTQAQLEKAQLEKDRLANTHTALDAKTSVTTSPEPKSSKPLILTTLALFASIGANAYLGWLAWSFFWRFRDAASDLSRARSNAFPAGSIAGH